MNVFLDFFVDQERCIGCRACEAACSECDTHRGEPMVHVDFVEPGLSPQTSPTVCLHCVNPTCASVCPADAIKVDEHGIVHSSLKPRCISCRNCELACPFGVPKMRIGALQMQKCDMCFDRTSDGKKPMCATVCPTGALWYGTADEMRELRPNSGSTNKFRFGDQEITTRVHVMVPRGVDVLVVDGPAAAEQRVAPVAPPLAPKKEAFFL